MGYKFTLFSDKQQIRCSDDIDLPVTYILKSVMCNLATLLVVPTFHY